MKMEQSVPKRRHIKFRRRGITQKKVYSINRLAFITETECVYCEVRTGSLNIIRANVNLQRARGKITGLKKGRRVMQHK